MGYSTSTNRTLSARFSPCLMLLRNKGWTAFLTVLTTIFFAVLGSIFTGRSAISGQWVEGFKAQSAYPCSNDVQWLSSLNIAFPVRYARRGIDVLPTKSLQRALLTRVDDALLPEFQIIDLTEHPIPELKYCKNALQLPLPASSTEPTDASHVIFGISTTLARLEASVPLLLRWLPHTQAQLYVVVIESDRHDGGDAVAAEKPKKEELQTRMRGLGIAITLIDPLELQDSFSERYFSLVKIMWDHRNEHTKWMALIEDDTFFPSVPALLAMLEKYNANEKHYVGALSEDWWPVTTIGMMGFGGAGIFLSHALLEVMNQHYDLCKETSHALAGDVRIMECVYAISNSKLANERDLHQMNLTGDVSGMFESGRLPLSLHYQRPRPKNEEQEVDVLMMHTIADVCQDCFLQRWRFKGDMILSNGYSIATYPEGDLKKLNLDYTEETFDPARAVDFSVNRGFDHSLGPFRPKLELDKQKIQHKLIASSAVDGGVRQAYLHKGVDGDMDSLIEIFWRAKDLNGTITTPSR